LPPVELDPPVEEEPPRFPPLLPPLDPLSLPLPGEPLIPLSLESPVLLESPRFPEFRSSVPESLYPARSFCPAISISSTLVDSYGPNKKQRACHLFSARCTFSVPNIGTIYSFNLRDSDISKAAE
jgi:hypothetical protein